MADLLQREKDGENVDSRLHGVLYVSVTSWIVAERGNILLAEKFTPNFGSEEGDKQKLLTAYEERMRRQKLPVRPGAAMRMTVDDFIKKQLS